VALVTPGPGDRRFRRGRGGRRAYPWAGFGAPFAVVAGSPLMAAPVVPLLARSPAWTWGGAVPAAVAAYLLARRISPPWWKRQRDRLAGRALLLLFLVAGVELSALLSGLWRLPRWLRYGPPAWPGPPGLTTWPPEPGQVWNATVDRQDRAVVVWEVNPDCTYVLPVTPSETPAEQLRLPLAEWHRVLSDDAWLSLELTPVPYTGFRSVRGQCPERFWERVGRRTLGAPRREPTAIRRRLRAAANR
jgi:hypothetical protein